MSRYPLVPMSLIDALGTIHQPAPHARIVSLVPSLTEMLCDFGLAARLVGRTGFCIHPHAAVAGIAKVGGTKDVNVDKIRRLAPTHVIVNIDENERPTADLLAEFVPNMVVTHPAEPRDNLSLARLLGGIFGASVQAELWCAAFEAEYALLRAAPKGRPLSVLYCIWKNPWMSVSSQTYIARMLAEIGWSTPDLGPQRYPAFDWTDRALAAIDCVLLSTEPYRFQPRHVEELAQQIGKPVYLVDGEMLSWYGTRSLAGLTYLRQLAGRTRI